MEVIEPRCPETVLEQMAVMHILNVMDHDGSPKNWVYIADSSKKESLFFYTLHIQ